MRQDYTDKERADALDLYEEHGPTEAERRCGIPKGTIRSWAKREGRTTGQPEKLRAAHAAAQERLVVLRGVIRLKLAERAVELLDRINDSHVEFVGKEGRRETLERASAGATRDYMISVGIAIDKLRLELGEVTDRTEHVSASDFDREVRELTEKVRRQAPAANGNGNGH